MSYTIITVQQSLTVRNRETDFKLQYEYDSILPK